MTPQDKRAALFEYFKDGGGAKFLAWRKDGARLYDALNKMSDGAVDNMYQRMLYLKERDKVLKSQKEKTVYKRWKMPLVLFAVWGASCLLFFHCAKPDYALSCLDAFMAGSYFEELMSNLIHNHIERKHQKAGLKK